MKPLAIPTFDVDKLPGAGVEAPQTPIAPTLVFSAGAIGGRIVDHAMAYLADSHASLSGIVRHIRLTDDGWLDAGTTAEAASVRGPGQPVEILRGAEAIVQNPRLALTSRHSAYTLLPNLECYLVGSLSEEHVAEQLEAAMGIIGSTFGQGKHVTITCVLEIASAQAPAASASARAIAATGLTHAGLFLRSTARRGADHAYLICYENRDGRPMLSASDAETVAALYLVTWWTSSVRSDPRLVSVDDWDREQLPGVPTCDGLGCASVYFPQARLERYCSKRLAAELVRDGLLSPNPRADEQQLHRSVPLGWEHAVLQLLADKQGQPVNFDAYLELGRVRNEDLGDRLMSLDALIGRTRLEPVLEGMRMRADALHTAAAREVDSLVDGAITAAVGGTLSAEAFLVNLQQEVQDLRNNPRVSTPDDVPDLAAARREVEERVAACPRRSVVAVRTFLLALALGYGTTALLRALPDPWPTFALGLGVACAVLAVATTVWLILASEARVVNARNEFLMALRAKYASVGAMWANKLWGEALAGLAEHAQVTLDHVVQWRVALETLSADLQIAALEAAADPPESQLEVAVVSGTTFGACFSTMDADRVQLARDWLQVSQRVLTDWRENSVEAVSESLQAFTRTRFEEILGEQSVEAHLRPPNAGMDEGEAVSFLRTRSAPWLRYAAARSRPQDRDVLVVDRATQTSLGDENYLPPSVVIASSGDASRVTYVATVHGVALDELMGLDAVQADPASDANSRLASGVQAN